MAVTVQNRRGGDRVCKTPDRPKARRPKQPRAQMVYKSKKTRQQLAPWCLPATLAAPHQQLAPEGEPRLSHIVKVLYGFPAVHQDTCKAPLPTPVESAPAKLFSEPSLCGPPTVGQPVTEHPLLSNRTAHSTTHCIFNTLQSQHPSTYPMQTGSPPALLNKRVKLPAGGAHL
jgi:hypothetical protein